MFVKNISERTVLARVLGKKRVIEADEIVEMTDEEVENVTSMYPKIFMVVDSSTGSEWQNEETEWWENDDEVNLNDMTKPQLKVYAEKMWIILDEKKKKEEMLLDLSVELKKIEEKQTADIL